MQAADQTEKQDTLPAKSNGKHPGGRPTKYTPQILRNAKHYLAHWEETGSTIPSIAGLARYLGTCRERLHLWANDEDKKEFRNIINHLLSEQEQTLLNKGLDGTFNSTITKLVLSKHGYTENAGNSGTSVNVTINRDSIQVETGGQVLEIDTDK